MSKDLRIVNIVGMAPSTAAYPPLQGENWMINAAPFAYENVRTDVWFIMDGFKATDDYCRYAGFGDQYDKFVKQFKGQVYSYHPESVQELDGKELMKSDALYINELRKIAGTHFASSISWMLAFAAAQEELGFKKIDIVNLVGIELWISHDGNEYKYQSVCADFWIAYLLAKKIQVNIPAYMLFALRNTDNLYGFIGK